MGQGLLGVTLAWAGGSQVLFQALGTKFLLSVF